MSGHPQPDTPVKGQPRRTCQPGEPFQDLRLQLMMCGTQEYRHQLSPANLKKPPLSPGERKKMHPVTSPTVKDLFLAQMETECQVTSRLGERSQDVVPLVPSQQGLGSCLPRGQLDPRRTFRPAPTSDTGN